MSTFKIEGAKLLEALFPEWNWEELAREKYEEIFQKIHGTLDLEDEVTNLFPLRTLNALQTVGYSELFEHLEGRISKDEAVSLIKQHTRNYAKRQLTWFRKDPSVSWFAPNDLGAIINYCEKQIDGDQSNKKN